MNIYRSIAILFVCLITNLKGQEANETIRPIALYLFEKGSEKVVEDRSGIEPLLHLYGSGPEGSWSARESSLTFRGGKSLFHSRQPARKLIEAAKRSGQLSVEVWLDQCDLGNQGPARIVTLSKNPNERNFTLGQDRDAFDVRLRTTRTSRNGIPSLSSGKNRVKQGLTHLVFTREKSGAARIYINGNRVAERRIDGDFSNWDPSMRLAVGNELTGDRAWKGRLHRVAIFDRAIPASRVRNRFERGAKFDGDKRQTEEDKLSKNRMLFAQSVAPVLAGKCTECHDPATREGDFDLTTPQTAAAAIKPGDSAKSLLWEVIEADDMPHKRPPLLAAEKKAIKDWIDGGAAWDVKRIDPANYLFSEAPTGAARSRRLTVNEYIETVRATFDVDIAKDAVKTLPSDSRADGFSNTAYNLNVDFQHVQGYALLAAGIAAAIDPAKFARRFSSKRNVNDKDMRQLISDMGEWILRGPIQSRELDIYRGITTTVVSAGGDFDDAVRGVVEAMAQSPRFLYRVEESSQSLTGHELACRISYIIWGAPPDKTLRDIAKSGELHGREACRSEIRRLLQDPRAKRRCLAFGEDWLNLGRLDHLQPDRKRFPKWNHALAQDMKRETLAFFEEIVWDGNEPMVRLLNKKIAYLTPALAEHYGIPYTGGRNPFVRHDLSHLQNRGGLLTQGSILTIGGDDASMVTRGLFVHRELLRAVVKDPPPCIDTTPVPTSEGQSQRAIAEKRIANKSCGGCHEKFEPLAFGLEKFDGLGAFHEKDEHGNRLREDGEILFPGEAKPVAYRSIGELMNFLAESGRTRETIAWKLTQFAIGRPLGPTDLAAMESIISQLEKSGGTYRGLIEAIILSDLVQK